MTRWGESVRFSCRVLLGPLFLLVGCYGSSSVGGVNRTPGSTETGNPPVIDVTKVALVVKRDEVHVTGEDGAVTPGGVAIEVETLSTGDVARGMSDGKGAFDIRVDGTIDDTYQLRALGAAKDVKSAPVYLYSGGASVGEGDGGTFSCEQRASVIEDRLTQAADAVDHACDTNADCTILHAPVECPAWQCSGVAVAHAGAGQVDPTFANTRAGDCQDFKDAGCWASWPVADCARPGPSACVAGRCVDCTKDDCSGASCEPCETPEIIWAPTGPVIGDSHTIVDCKTLVTNFADGSPQCSTTLPCTSSRSGGRWSFAHLQNLLGDPTVKDALESDKNFAPILPVGMRLTIGAHSMTDGDASCTPQTCAVLPGQVEELFALLDSIAVDQSCATGPNPGEACDMPFDPGTGSDSTLFTGVYTFDAGLGTCIGRTYKGAGGNANRFDSLASCRAACPPVAAADTCGSDRVFIANDCLECGPVGGCGTQGDVCTLRCTNNSDCTDGGYQGLCRPDGTCGAYGCE